MSIKYIYMIAEAVDDCWECKALCMQRGNADKMMDDLVEQSDNIYGHYMFRTPLDRIFKYPLVGVVTEQDALLKNGCLTLEVYND